MPSPTPSSQASGSGSRPAAPAKRSAPSDIHSRNPERPWKRRSSKACLSCRTRKVRCDVVDGGAPCTNCRLDDIDCVLKESNRGRRPASASAATASQRNNDRNPNHQQHDREPLDEIHVQVQKEHDSSAQDSAPAPTPMQRLTPDPSLDYIGQIRIGNGPFATTQAQMDQLTPALPLFIRPPPRHLDSRDMDYLSHKLCLSIPDPDFRHELLRVYVNVVHPVLPILDLDDYIGSILNNNGRNPISLLLFQAVNFVSVTFVGLKFLQSRGYVSRSAARRDFFDRVRILYSLNYESDRMILIQSLLLLTHWYDGPDDDKDTWYWMGTALTNAQVGGLHRTPEHLKISPQEKRLRRRVWWCCIMRDRLLALGIRSPPRINEDEYNVKPLTLDDFDLSSPVPNVDKLFRGSKVAYPDAEKRQILAVMCIELSSLCVYIGRTLNTLYTVMGNYLGGVEYTQQSSARPDQSPEQVQALAKRSTELKDWVESQNVNSRYTPKTGSRVTSSNTADGLQGDSLVYFHQAQLRIVYLTALGALNRPQVFCYGSGGDSESNLANAPVSRENVTDTAVEMTKLAFNLQRDGQLGFLPTLAVPAYLAVTLVHLFNTCSNDEEIRSLSLGRLYHCISVLQQLQDMYTSADYALQFLNSILKNTGLHVPWMTGSFTSPTGCKEVAERDTNRPRLDMGPNSVAISCMYPSPSTSGNWNPNQDSADESGLGQENTQQADIVQQQPMPLSFPSVITETWATTGQGDIGDLLAGSPFTGSWCDVETLLPALLNFEGETRSSMSGNLSVFM
ncbi:hypothetical protein KAF25_001971 [Fusarium avenaceum]|uniref:Zn(2)-C6 fungal-type domain-containing protein n=1 Tax=Fusarium avenaceum TaxID=40199 RepID=A0A9P7GVK2_9HYPO|nr:hypothetical protein KAF25_001971 [Fusarium avenaceum]